MWENRPLVLEREHKMIYQELPQYTLSETRKMIGADNICQIKIVPVSVFRLRRICGVISIFKMALFACLQSCCFVV